MRPRTRAELIASVPMRWAKQYEDGANEKQKSITILLISEKPTTEERVAEIIGNSSWVRNICFSCGNDVETTILIKQGGRYTESETICLCYDCLEAATKLALKFHK